MPDNGAKPEKDLQTETASEQEDKAKPDALKIEKPEAKSKENCQP